MSSEPIATPDRRGLCLILSSPSGAGKTTLARLLLASDASLGHSVSVTTRPSRAQEADGVDYYFVTRDRFEAMRDAGELLEWAEVFGNFYGTPAEPVKAALAEGRDMLFDVDWQGASSIAALLPEDAVRVFILPPSGEELSRRIYSRGTDPEHVIEARLEGAEAEISHWGDYDYVLVNRNVEDSLAVLRGIVTAERHRRHRQVGLRTLIAQLAPPSRAR
ncbi:guanylate kinase [Rhodomicrobium vannielii ATCC 17100]|uniref:guanylate kinase n=1 Tax=Rhodomicrobium vannielii TaxID=1069 RepID=UPI00191B6AB2|nr:guanylate kinase [Rhodomicrobium vannielii ATCC 17100]